MREPSRTLAGKCKSALLPSWDQLDEAATVLQWGSDRRAIDIVSVRNTVLQLGKVKLHRYEKMIQLVFKLCHIINLLLKY